MICLTRLGGSEVVINADLIVTVERTPDTVITLTTGDRIMVKESVDDVVDRAATFRHRVLQGPGVRADHHDRQAALADGAGGGGDGSGGGGA
ncbi:MAG TPA: flagellar FlbD family protein [Polyangia bacterium]|nr:flagellar FlbD family protein [Polyangia bacterium]